MRQEGVKRDMTPTILTGLWTCIYRTIFATAFLLALVLEAHSMFGVRFISIIVATGLTFMSLESWDFYLSTSEGAGEGICNT